MNAGLKELIRPLAVIGVAFAGVLGIEGWSMYYPESGIFAVAGMSGSRANDGRTCEKVRWTTFRGFQRVRDVRCVRSAVTADRSKDSSAAGHQFQVLDIFELPYHRREEVRMRFWSREPYMASISRAWRDSSSWAATVDSLRQTLTSRGAMKLECPDRLLGRVVGHLFSERWRDRGFEVGIQGIRVQQAQGAVFHLHVAAASRAYGC